MLKKGANDKMKEKLQSQCNRIIQADQMGEIYKFMCINSKAFGNY